MTDISVVAETGPEMRASGACVRTFPSTEVKKNKTGYASAGLRHPLPGLWGSIVHFIWRSQDKTNKRWVNRRAAAMSRDPATTQARRRANRVRIEDRRRAKRARLTQEIARNNARVEVLETRLAMRPILVDPCNRFLAAVKRALEHRDLDSVRTTLPIWRSAGGYVLEVRRGRRHAVLDLEATKMREGTYGFIVRGAFREGQGYTTPVVLKAPLRPAETHAFLVESYIHTELFCSQRRARLPLGSARVPKIVTFGQADLPTFRERGAPPADASGLYWSGDGPAGPASAPAASGAAASAVQSAAAASGASSSAGVFWGGSRVSLPFAVVQYVPLSGTAYMRRAARGPAWYRDQVRLIRSVALFLAHFQRTHRFMHGDLHLGNILCGDGDAPRVYVTDYGMSRVEVPGTGRVLTANPKFDWTYNPSQDLRFLCASMVSAERDSRANGGTLIHQRILDTIMPWLRPYPYTSRPVYFHNFYTQVMTTVDRNFLPAAILAAFPLPPPEPARSGAP